MFFKKSVLKSFAKLFCKSFFFNKRDPNTGVSLWIFRNFEEHLFQRTPSDDCFWNTNFFHTMRNSGSQDRPFWGCSRMEEGQKGPPSYNLSHISYNDKTWHSCTLPKEDPKNKWITWHTSCILLKSAFFQRKSANFAVSRNASIECIFLNNFYFFLSFFEC